MDDRAPTMDELLKDSVAAFAELASASTPPARVGRQWQHVSPEEGEAKEEAMLRDIVGKLRLVDGLSVLDLGCGCGALAHKWIRLAASLRLQLTLVDIPEVIDALRHEIGPVHGVRLLAGVFPHTMPAASMAESFDRIVLYSVVHYTTQSDLLIRRASEMLNPGGRLLIGDIPNQSKRGRFLATPEGRQLEAAYFGKPLKEIPIYRDAADFLARAPHPKWPHLNDHFILNILTEYRLAGFDVYVLEQPPDLAWPLTREDLLICRPGGRQ